MESARNEVAARSAMRVIGDMGEFAVEVLREIDEAVHTVDIECFIVRDDRLGDALAGCLTRAARRGVRCRLLYDRLGSRYTAAAYFRKLREATVDVRRYGLWAAFRQRRPLVRDHARVIVIDERVAYTGGHAWGDEWLPRSEGGRGWRDVCCGVDGPIVRDFARVFEQHWRETRGEVPLRDFDSGRSTTAPRLVSDAPVKDSLLLGAHLDAIAGARRRIWIANAYFFPPRDLLRALTDAAARGVEVKVIVPGVTDLPIMRRAGRAQYRRWLRAGFEVWEYQDVVMHAKYALVDDDWCLIGTFNANAISISFAIEVAVADRSARAVRAVETELRADLARSRRIDEQWLERRSRWTRLLDRFASVLLGIAAFILRGRRPAWAGAPSRLRSLA